MANEEIHKQMAWWQYLMIVLFVILCGLFSGNNIGIMAYDVGSLEMMSKGPYETKEDESMGQIAKKCIPLRKKGS